MIHNEPSIAENKTLWLLLLDVTRQEISSTIDLFGEVCMGSHVTENLTKHTRNFKFNDKDCMNKK